MDDIKGRLSGYLLAKGVSKSEFGRTIGVSSAYITSIRKSIQPDKLNKIAESYPDLNITWLLTGDGDMIVKSKNESNALMLRSAAKAIPLLPVSAQGGTLNDFVASIKSCDCEKVVSPINDVDFAIQIAGDSMAPEYPAGSRIFIKKINERAFIEWGKAYVLDTCNGTVVKLLAPSDKEGYVKCISINPDPIYAPFEVSFKDVFGIYRVMLCLAIK
ncbi:phage repressor [gut metagenome]|uniref:Phage repressor n=1 Tax=gut metagenome TaxID=749906 RepID=J9FZ94_9ZZZZ